ncbi:helix-turn-helix domain-containing protein [Dapis sp. BLCC M172]|uniref:helix-turn-helix domain-containing protein n=1 Tax=Dapis sp. BLCC M172 TaxID=2975281 RepID=UPI003CFA64B8
MPKNVKRRNPKSKDNWKRPPDNQIPMFVRSELDDYGLNLYEFRVLAHVIRRAGSKLDSKHGCYESQGRIAEFCGMSQRMVLEVLGVLCEAGILRKESHTGKRTNVYRLNPGSEWKHPKELENIRQRRKSPKTKKFQEKNEQVNETEAIEVEVISEKNVLAEEE